MVCSSAANALIRNGLFLARFAEKPNRINVWLQTTNLGVRSSNLFGRAISSKNYRPVALSFTQCGMLFESMLTTATPATMAESEKGRRVQRLLFRVDPLNLETRTPYSAVLARLR